MSQEHLQKPTRLSWTGMQKKYVGRKFRYRHLGITETKRVVDVTLGGDVIIRQRGYAGDEQVKQDYWLTWMSHAKEILK